MAKRKKVPDLLAEALGKEEDIASIPVKRHTSKVKGNIDQALDHSKNSLDGEHDVEKTKATFYLSPRIIGALEDAWYELRKRAVPENRRSISKSAIVETALRMALKELREEGDNSEFVVDLLSK